MLTHWRGVVPQIEPPAAHRVASLFLRATAASPSVRKGDAVPTDDPHPRLASPLVAINRATAFQGVPSVSPTPTQLAVTTSPAGPAIVCVAPVRATPSRHRATTRAACNRATPRAARQRAIPRAARHRVTARLTRHRTSADRLCHSRPTVERLSRIPPRAARSDLTECQRY